MEDGLEVEKQRTRQDAAVALIMVEVVNRQQR